MNVWSINKDISIKVLLLQLNQEKILDKLHLDESENLDFRATRISDQRFDGLCAYIYTYGQSENHFGLQLEYPQIKEEPVKQSETYEELTLQNTITIISTHFDIT